MACGTVAWGRFGMGTFFVAWGRFVCHLAHGMGTFCLPSFLQGNTRSCEKAFFSLLAIAMKMTKVGCQSETGSIYPTYEGSVFKNNVFVCHDADKTWKFKTIKNYERE